MKTRNERLADYYLEAAGIAGVVASTDGARCVRVVTIDPVPGMVCCGSFLEAMNLSRAQTIYGGMTIEQRAGKMGIGITSHEIVVSRAHSAVAAVNAMMADMHHNGGLKDANARFKYLRYLDRSLRYADFLHAHKETMLEAMARENER